MTRSELRDLPSTALRTDWTWAEIAGLFTMWRLPAGRESMNEATPALCFMTGANSIFTGGQMRACSRNAAE
jgi:hypothetical protein